MKAIVKESLTREEENTLFRWKEQVFPIEARDFTWRKPERHIVIYQETAPIAHLGFGIFELEVNDKKMKTIGVGGVVVRPEFQKQYIPTILFGTLHDLDLSLETEAVYSLFCPQRLTNYYSHHGYNLISDKVEFLQRGKLVDAGSAKFMVRGAIPKGDVKIMSEPW